MYAAVEKEVVRQKVGKRKRVGFDETAGLEREFEMEGKSCLDSEFEFFNSENFVETGEESSVCLYLGLEKARNFAKMLQNLALPKLKAVGFVKVELADQTVINQILMNSFSRTQK